MQLIPSLLQGGAERVLSDLVTHMPDTVSSSVVTLLDEEPAFDVGSIPITTLGIRRGHADPRAIPRLLAQVRTLKPDVIHAWMYHCNLLTACTLSTPIIWSIHNTTLPSGQTRLLTRTVDRLSAVLSPVVPARIVYCAEKARQEHEARGYMVSKGIVIRNGVDVACFPPNERLRAAKRQELGIRPDDTLLGVVARFDPQKDFANVLAAFARVLRQRPTAKLALVGRGNEPSNTELVALCRSFDVLDHVLFLGVVRDIHGILSAIDILVIGSAFGEALPMAALEAAAAHVPIITTDVADFAELGFAEEDIVPSGNSERLAEAVLARLAKQGQPEDAHRLSEIAARVDATFSLQTMIREYVRVYFESCPRTSQLRGENGPLTNTDQEKDLTYSILSDEKELLPWGGI
ncbi:MAG TPA: glycosyltransferase [Methyloceanibacter sp.]|jgi:glycosyltransferase involved in cell wall biosynthesis